MENISLNIRYLIEKKTSQTKFAQELKVDRKTVVNWISGKSTPASSLVPTIARILRVPISVLFMPYEEVRKAKNLYEINETNSSKTSAELDSSYGNSNEQRIEDLKAHIADLRAENEFLKEQIRELNKKRPAQEDVECADVG